MSIKKLTPAEEISYVIQRAYQRNMVSSAGGCMSVRDEDGSMWISPTSQDKGDLDPAIMARYSMDGKQMSEYKGSMEWDNHLAILKNRPDVKAIFHTHSSGILSAAFARQAVDNKQFVMDALATGEIAQVPFSVPASQELLEDVVEAVKKGVNVLTLDSHGSYVLSDKSLFEAFRVQDLWEMNSRTEAVAPAIGKLLPPLTDTQVSAYKKAMEAERYETLVPEEETPEVAAAREQLCRLSKRGYDNGVMDIYQSSLSIKIGEDDFIITPAGNDLANLEPQDTVRVREGKVEAGKSAPARTGIHRKVYQKKEYAGSVLINTSPYAAAYCITDANFDCTIDPELTFYIKGVKKYPFMEQLDKVIDGLDDQTHVVIMEHDCIVSTGVDAVKALGVAECLEYATHAVADMAYADRKPVKIAEYN